MNKRLFEQKTVDTKHCVRVVQSFPVRLPLNNIDMSKWVTEMTDADYVSYSKAHLMMTSFYEDDVLHMKNLENIGSNSLIQRYELKFRSGSHVQFYSENTSAYVMRWFPAKVAVAWEMQVNRTSDDSCELTCLVGIDFPSALLKFAWASGLGAYFLREHLDEEGKNFAKDIENKFRKKETIMNATAATAPLSANSTGELYVSGALEPLRNEVTAFDLEVIGTIPEELNGRFLRTGPNPIEEHETAWLKGHHWFAGSGMVHGLRLRDGKADWFRSRFVVDRNVAKLRGYAPIPGPAEGQRDGPVNTNAMVIGGKVCMGIEAGNLPVELNYELESVQRTDLDGTLEAGFSGHTHFDPLTGEQILLAYEAFAPVRYISIGSDGRATTKAKIDLPHIPMIHDTAFTQSFVIVPDFSFCQRL